MDVKDYKTRILDSAAEIINKEGIRGLTISKIVHLSKISNRNFYECFSSKEELHASLEREKRAEEDRKSRCQGR